MTKKGAQDGTSGRADKMAGNLSQESGRGSYSRTASKQTSGRNRDSG